MGSSFLCPMDLTRTAPSWLLEERWMRGKTEKVSSGQFGPRQACMWEGQRLARRDVAKTWAGRPKKGPNCTAFCQFTSRICPGCTRAITVAGNIMDTIIPVINMPPTVGGEGVSSLIHGLCFRFSYSTGSFSVIHRIVKITNSISCLLQKVAQHY